MKRPQSTTKNVALRTRSLAKNLATALQARPRKVLGCAPLVDVVDVLAFNGGGSESWATTPYSRLPSAVLKFRSANHLLPNASVASAGPVFPPRISVDFKSVLVSSAWRRAATNAMLQGLTSTPDRARSRETANRATITIMNAMKVSVAQKGPLNIPRLITHPRRLLA